MKAPLIVDEPLSLRILGEKRRLLMEGTVADALGSIGAVVVISFAEWGHASHVQIGRWLVAMLALLVVQLALPRLLRASGDRAFLRAYTALSVALGLMWAACVILVRPDDFAFEAFVVLALCVVFTAGSVFSGNHPPALLALMVSGLGCLAGVYALRGGTINWSIAAGFAILMWTLIGYGMAFHRGLVRAVELGFENARLVGELTAKSRALERASAAKTRFLSSASHDLRQPLHAMTLLVSLLSEKTNDPALQDVIARIDESAGAMESLLNGILDLSKLDAGSEHPAVESLSTARILGRIERSFAPVAASLGLALRVRAGDGWIRSDAVLLGRMLDNIVGNALRHTPGGGVLVGVRTRGDAAVFEVWDTGIGIPHDRLDDIFHEFVQLQNPARDRTRGLGLGLSIVRRTAELLGHAVEVESRPGRGTVFRIVVPRAAAPESVPQEASAPASRDLAALSVLVVDDEAAIRDAMRALLEAWGCDCVAAPDGDAALVRWAPRDAAPDAILCDYRFATETGVDVVARLREAFGESVPALIVTGDVTTDQLIDIASSDLPVMHKPVNAASLRGWLRGVAVQAADRCVLE